MKQTPALSDGEWEVMDVLWGADGPLLAEQIVDRISGRKSWSPRTVKTLLNRLIKKGALEFESQGKRYLYRPAVPREQCVGQASKSFLSRVFGGSAGPMLVHFVTHAKLSTAELAELQRLLVEKQSAPATKPTKKAR
jgi:BlaI family penicillinase repressor